MEAGASTRLVLNITGDGQIIRVGAVVPHLKRCVRASGRLFPASRDLRWNRATFPYVPLIIRAA